MRAEQITMNYSPDQVADRECGLVIISFKPRVIGSDREPVAVDYHRRQNVSASDSNVKPK